MVKYSTERLLNTAEAAQFLRVSQASIRRWSDSGILVAQRVGRRRARRFSESDLQAFMQRPASTRAGMSSVNAGGDAIAIPGHVATMYSSDAVGLRSSPARQGACADDILGERLSRAAGGAQAWPTI